MIKHLRTVKNGEIMLQSRYMIFPFLLGSTSNLHLFCLLLLLLRCSSDQPEGIEVALAFDLDVSPLLGDEAARQVYQHLRLAADLDLARLRPRLHPRGRVDGVAEEAVPGG